MLSRFQGSSGSPYSSFRFMQDIMYVAHLVTVSPLSSECQAGAAKSALPDQEVLLTGL